jgi:hypothetical protein
MGRIASTADRVAAALALTTGLAITLGARGKASIMCSRLAGTLFPERWIALGRAWHVYHALGPLWRRVTAAAPEVLLPGGSACGGVEYALYRRIIEIRDAQRILRRYRDPTMPDGLALATKGLQPADAELIVEVAELATALAGHRSGRRYQTGPVSTWIPQRRPIGNVRAEGRWLVQVARALSAISGEAAITPSRADVVRAPEPVGRAAVVSVVRLLR